MHIQTIEVLPILDPAADAAGRSSRAVSLKNYSGAIQLVAYINQGAANTVALTPQQCTDVAGAGAKAIPAVPIYSAQDVATTTVATRETAAASFTTSASVTAKRVMFLIDPAALDVAGGFDCIRLNTGASSASNITSAVVIARATNAVDLGNNARAN